MSKDNFSFIDGILDEQFKRLDGTIVLPIYNRPTAIAQAKEQLVAGFKAAMLEVIGEDEETNVRESMRDPETNGANCLRKQQRNNLERIQ